jgi:non-ribosomal peptide synthetase-like protein
MNFSEPAGITRGHALPAFAGQAPNSCEPDEQQKLLHEIFAATAKEHADRVALRLAAPDARSRASRELTYAELKRRASSFAHYLRARNVKRGDHVLVCLPRGFDQYTAVLGILECGAAYVPVDWSYPRKRVNYIARKSSATAIVTTGARKSTFKNIAPVVVAIDEERHDIAEHDSMPLTRAATGCEPDDLAYLIYTSGSSGRPKGVMIRHRNIAFQIQSEGSILGVTRDDIVYAGASLAFDVSVEEMWAAFAVGATLLVSSQALVLAGRELAEMLTAEGVTVWCPVPSQLASVADPLPTVRLLNVGGEVCPPELAKRWATGSRRMINTYGPTETSVTATWAELSADTPVTIGKPLPGFTAWIVDRALQPVAPGESGELLIGGHGVGEGYWRQPGLTGKKFVLASFAGPSGVPERVYRTGDLVRLNADGDIEFIGRIDLQVKIRGFRVELGEIETVLGSDAAVAQAVVKHFSDADGADLLVAFLTARPGASIDLDRLRALAAKCLPAYMRPQAYELRDALPALISGKVNRRALGRPHKFEAAARTVEPPSNPMERKLLAVWSSIFQLTSICVRENFFEDLGGHSLRAARMVSLARMDADLRGLSLQDLYAAPTIRTLARRLKKQGTHAPREEKPFPAIPQLRRTLCVIGQTFALVPIFAFAGMQWMLPYLVYIGVSAHNAQDPLPALGAAAASFVALPPILMALSIAVKWIVIGRFKPGDYPLWGGYYFRWWFVRRFLAVIPMQFLSGTPWMAIYYRLLGANIGPGAFLSTANIDAPDLVNIGAGAILSQKSVLATVSVERGQLRIGRCDIGERAFIGTAAVVGRAGKVGNDAALEDLSALPAGEAIPDGEVWTGSPAVRRGSAKPCTMTARVGHLRRALVMSGLLVAALLLPLAALIPIAPGLVLMTEPDWLPLASAPGDMIFVALSPLLALLYVIGMCALTVAAKWMLLGRVRPGTRSIWSWFYIRYWFIGRLGELALEILHPLYATLYLRPWYRALGARIGERAEISTASSVVHDLIDVGPESFVADGAMFGIERVEQDAIRLEHTRIGRRTFIGNSAVLPIGADVRDSVLVGVLSTMPRNEVLASEPDAVWFGSPAIRLPRREVTTGFDEAVRYRPPPRLVAIRLAIEYLRITLPLTAFISFFGVLLTIIGDLSQLPNGPVWIATLFPALYLGFAVGLGLFAAALKWIVIGRYRPVTAPLWSNFVWRAELVTAVYENLAIPLLLEPLRGTPYLNIYLRLLGCRIGRRVFTDTTDITEHDLVSIGDDCALNEKAGLQTHLFEDRVMKVAGVRIGRRATVGSLAIVLYDSLVEDDAQLGDLSVLMKGETLPAGTAWEGSPASPVRAAS